MAPQPSPPTAPAAADETTFRYAAFISYRHVEPDRQWAKWLHTSLETYRVPKNLVREKGLAARVGRVFRDEEELPASDDLNAEIESALSQSRFLVVVCSPRTPQSRWVNREVERFREMGRHERILALLVEGEPSEAFPRSLREIRHTVTDRDGGSVERVEEVEPLAADVRRSRREGGRYLRRMAKLRVLACVLGVTFDDLRRREQERRARRLAYLGAVLAALLCVVGALAVYAFHERDLAVGQRRIAEAQRAEAQAQRAEAQAQRALAEAQRRRAEVALAEGTVLHADLLGSAGRWVEARAGYADAAGLFHQNNAPPLTADLGLWDASRHVDGPLLTLAGHTDGVFTAAVSPDGRQVLSGGADNTVRLWDLHTGQLIRTLTGHGGTVHAVAFLPGGRALSAAEDKTVRLWDLASGRELRAYPHAAPVRVLAASADGGRFLSGDSVDTLTLWDVAGAGGDPVRSIKVGRPPFCLALSADARQALCGASDAKVRLFDLDDGKTLRTFAGHAIAPTAVAFLPDGKTVFSGGYDNTFRFWDVATGAATRVISNPTGRVSGVALSPDGRTVLAGLFDGTLKSWTVADATQRRTFVGPSAGPTAGPVRRVAFSPDGRTAVSASTDKTLDVWLLAGGRMHVGWKYGSPIQGTGFADEGRLAFTATAGRLELWDVASEQTLYSVGHPGVAALDAVLCPDGRTALVAGIPAALLLIDLTGRRPTLSLAGHRGMIVDVAVSPDGRTALSGGDDNTARVWDLSTGAQLHVLPHDNSVNIVAFSPDGHSALTGGLSGLRLWDAGSWKERRALAPAATNVTDACSAAAFSPDGRSVLAGTQAGSVRLFDVDGGGARVFTGGHTGTVGRLAFRGDGLRAVSAGDDHTLRLWDVESGRQLRALVGHEDAVRTVAYSPDGRYVLSGGADGSLELWDLKSSDVAAEKQATLAAARDALEKSPGGGDVAARAKWLAALGEWYAVRGLPDWAADVSEQARAAGGDVSPLTLGRCYWQTGRREDAKRELTQAIDRREAPEAYLRTCLAGLAPPPATAPATTTAPVKAGH